MSFQCVGSHLLERGLPLLLCLHLHLASRRLRFRGLKVLMCCRRFVIKNHRHFRLSLTKSVVQQLVRVSRCRGCNCYALSTRDQNFLCSSCAVGVYNSSEPQEIGG